MSKHTTPSPAEINSNFDPTHMSGEVFKPIPGYEGLYDVSDFGRVRSFKGLKPRVLKGNFLNSAGCPRVVLCRDGKTKYAYVHRLVALAHLGPAPEGKPNAIHENDDKADNRLANICYGTQARTLRDKVNNGDRPKVIKTHCPQGHEYVVANTYDRANGKRQCIACYRTRSAAQYAAKTGRTIDFNEIADQKYIELTTAPGANLAPVHPRTLAAV